MILEEIKYKLDEINQNDIQLYFITRILKADKKKWSKVLDKYDFKTYQIDVNDEIREHLFKVTENQVAKLLKQKTEIQEYDVITDDTQSLFTYSMKNKAMSFSDVVTNQLKNNPPKVQSLEEIIIDEELWAYSVGLYHSENDWIYSFRKIFSGKVAIDERKSNKRGPIQKQIRTIFNTKSQKLELIEGETVNLDKLIDCIYYKDIFYIAKKGQFEKIVGLEEEYKKQANDVVDELKSTGMIEGLKIITDIINSNPAIHKKLVRLFKIGNYKELSTKNIKQMQKICEKYGDNLKVKNGKLILEDEDDVNLALKMLADYYKRGEVSGKAYGTYAGKQIEQ